MRRRRKVIVVTVVLLLLGLVGLAWLAMHRFSPEPATASWTYRSASHGFSIILPSSDWKEIKKQDADVAFHNPNRSVLVGVNVLKESHEAFQKDVQAMTRYLARTRDELLSEPQLTEGVTASGNPYAYWTVRAKAEQGGAVFIARSLVWCKDKELTVSVMIEGPLAMQSRAGKAGEDEYYHNAAKTICLSVQ